MYTFIVSLTKLLSILSKLLFPKFCILCDKYNYLLCEECESRLKLNHRTLPDWIHSKYSYEDSDVRKLLFKLKYDHVEELGYILGQYSRDHLKQKVKDGQFLLIPVPISKSRLSERGYNQALSVAGGLANGNNNFKICDALTRTKNTNKLFKTQNIDERKIEIENSFTVNDQFLEEIKNKDVIIIDDITTTGVTLYEIRKLLIPSGVKSVIAFTVAH